MELGDAGAFDFLCLCRALVIIVAGFVSFTAGRWIMSRRLKALKNLKLTTSEKEMT